MIMNIHDNLMKKGYSEDEIKDIIYEFDEGITEEAKFAYHCDKLECDLQSKLYDEEVWFDGNLRIPVDTTFKGISPECNGNTNKYDVEYEGVDGIDSITLPDEYEYDVPS